MTKIKFNIKSIYFVVCNTTRQHVYMKVPILKGHIKFHSEWDQEVMTAKKKKIKKVGLSQCCTNSVRRFVLATFCTDQLKCDGTRTETRSRLSAKRTSPFESAGGRPFSRLLAAEVCASAVVILDTPRSEVVWRVLATHSIRQFPLHFPSRASTCAITFLLESTAVPSVCGSLARKFQSRIWCQEFNGGSCFEWPIVNLAEPYSMYRPGCATLVNDFWTDTPVNFANNDKRTKQNWETLSMTAA